MTFSPCPVAGGYCVVAATQSHNRIHAQFAVRTHNSQNLTFLSVVEAQRRVVVEAQRLVVNGLYYKLAIHVRDHPFTRVYEAIVHETPRGRQTLKKFEPLLPLPSPPLPNSTLAESAVAKANDISKKNLSFVSAVEAQLQALHKINNYRIAVQVFQSRYSRVYKAQVSVF
ncbi:hypothetical protein AMTRI_Chr10g230080 [Amborella trichopoda]